MQGLHHRDIQRLSHRIGRGRDQRKGVVEVQNIRALPLDKLVKFLFQPGVIAGIDEQFQLLQRGVAPDLIIVAGKLQYFMPVGLQQRLFIAEHPVFAAGLLVEIMDEENAHIKVKGKREKGKG